MKQFSSRKSQWYIFSSVLRAARFVGLALPSVLLCGFGLAAALPAHQSALAGRPGSNRMLLAAAPDEPTPTPDGDPTPTPGGGYPGYPGNDPTPTPVGGGGYPGYPTATPTPDATPTPAPTPTPLAALHVDALIHNGTNVILNGNNPPAYLGAGIYNTTGAQQTATQTTVPANAAVYSIKAQNNTSSSSPLLVTGGASGNGWTATYFDALQGGNDITAQVTGTGWTTPTLDPGSAYELRLEVAPDTTLGVNAANSIPVTVALPTDATILDVAQATTTRTREITGLRYSLDNGTTWIALPQPGDATFPLTANYDDVIGFKIVRTHPEQPWPLLPDPGPTWDHRGYPYIGEAIWVRFNQVSPDDDHLDVVTAKWGDTLTAQLKVLPAVPDA